MMLKAIQFLKNIFSKPYSISPKVILGHKYLKKNHDIEIIRRLKHRITITPIDDTRDYIFTKQFLLHINKNHEIILRQFLISRLLDLSFEKAILKYFGSKKSSFLYPLPKIWQNLLTDEGIKVSRFSSLYFFCYSLAWFFYGIFYSLELFFFALKESLFLKSRITGNYSFFYKLNQLNFSSDENSSIISEFISKKLVSPNDTLLHDYKFSENRQHHSSHSSYLKYIFISNISSISLIPILFKIFWISFIAFLLLITGRKYPMLMVHAEIEGIFADYSFRKARPDYIFFHNINYAYKPLWVVIAEHYGACSTLYYYSSNIFSFDNFYHAGMQTMNWQQIYTWSNDQKTYLDNATLNSCVTRIVGPIKFFYNDPSTDLVLDGNNKKLLVGIFDVQPQRNTALTSLGFENNYYSYNTSKKFIADIVKIFEGHPVDIIFKRKRDTRLADPRYVNFIKKLSKQKNFIEVNPSIDPEDIIQTVDLVISMPHTSTALIGIKNKKPSMFYDSTGRLSDSPYNDVEIISSTKSLEDWVNKVIDSK